MKPLSVLSMACILFALCLSAVPAYPWSSYNGGSHLTIDNAAYDELSEMAGFDPVNFPAKKSISEYEGWVYGPDAAFKALYENYKYSNHYYNPDTGEGYAPERAKYWYSILVKEIRKGNAKKSGEAAKAAAYLAHYVADVGVPYHVSTKGHPAKKPFPAYKDWNDPYYKEEKLVPAGPHVDWEKNAAAYSCEDCTKYSGTSEECESSKPGHSQIEGFVKKIAARTNKASGSDARDLIGHSIQDVYTVYNAAYDEGTILGAARWFIETKSGKKIAEGHDFILLKIAGDYALVDMVPLKPPLQHEGLWNGMIMEKHEGRWVVASTATTVEWREKVPELFK